MGDDIDIALAIAGGLLCLVPAVMATGWLSDPTDRQFRGGIAAVVAGSIAVGVAIGDFKERTQSERIDRQSQACIASGRTLQRGSQIGDCQDAQGRLYANSATKDD